MDFPIFKTKSDVYKKFDLTDFNQRQAYFEYKAGPELKKLREYLGVNSREESKKIAHFSIGDMVRSCDEIIGDEDKTKELVVFLENNYRGYLPLEDIIKSLKARSTKTLLPSELILVLAKREIAKLGRKAIFIDGFPRDLDQISYSLFFRDLIGYREDPDIFVLIDVPTSVIDQRVKYRVICPSCQTSRSLKLLPTKNVEYDAKDDKFYLICDNPNCKGFRMTTKEGDELGIEPIRERLNKDELLIKQAESLQGIPKVFLRNCIPVQIVKDFVDDYEITPEYSYTFNENPPAGGSKVKANEKPWEVLDDQGVVSNSLMPPPVVVSLIKQLVKALGI
ncbi:MAG: hypothetical protein HYS02_02575 [Candidatus Staskawiczbacteria bacterium]|nr:hypothetical protein [Candidatus Staskawiczbacteria bacterium]